MKYNVQALVLRAESATANRWLTAVSADLILFRSRVSLARAIWALIGGSVDEAEPILTDAESAFATIDFLRTRRSEDTLDTLIAYTYRRSLEWLRPSSLRWQGARDGHMWRARPSRGLGPRHRGASWTSWALGR